jgi:Sec-independent protein translocase protein TatA
MARWRKVETGTWADERFRELSQNGRMLWLYLLCGHRTTTFPGLVVAREAVVADDLGWSLEAFREAFREASSKGMAKADWKAGLTLLPRALLDSAGEPRDTARPESPNVLKSWAKSWDEIPECPLKAEYLRHLGSFAEALGEGFTKAYLEGFRKALAKASANQEKEKEKEQEQEKEECAAPIAPLVLIPGEASPLRAPPSQQSRAIAKPATGYTETVALFDRLFFAQNGVKPTWGAKQGAQLKALLERHGAPEVQRRTEILFAGRGPAFIRSPFDLGTLVMHFDKLAAPADQAPRNSGRDLSTDDLGRMAEELRRRGM